MTRSAIAPGRPTSPVPLIHLGDSLTRGRRLTYILVLGALTALGPFTIDLYLPAFPIIEGHFAVSAATVQLTLAFTMVGFALGQLIVGPWSDRVGRRLPLVLATVVHVSASLAVAAAPSIEWLMGFRVLQGLGAAAGSVVAMAVVRDLFTGIPMVRMFSRLALVSGLAPVLAPVIGSQLLLVMPWQGMFVALAVYGAVLLVAVWLLVVETLPPERRHSAGHSTARQRYRSVLTDRVFIGAAIFGGMVSSGLFAYVSFSPFLFQGAYAFDAQQYGLLFGTNAVGVIVGTQTAALLVRRIGPQWVLAGANLLAIASAAVIVSLDLAEAGLIGVLIPLFFFMASCGFSFPCVSALALAQHGSEAGTAASLLGATTFGLAGLVSPVVGLFGTDRALPMGGIMLICALIGCAMLWLVVRPRTVPPLAR